MKRSGRSDPRKLRSIGMNTLNTKEIAQSLGLSRATVSNVINNKGRVSASTRERVEAALVAAGYIQDRSAIALRKGYSRLVGVLVTDIANPFYGQVVSHLEAELAAAGYVIVLSQSHDDPEKQAQILDELVGNGVSGLIVNPCVGTRSVDLQSALRREIPIVLFVRDIEGSGLDFVSSDDVAAGAMLAEHMLSEGYRRFAVIGGNAGTTTFERRVCGLASVLNPFGCTLRIYNGPISEDFGYETARRLFMEKADFDAVIGHNDIVALGCLRALRELGCLPGAKIGLAGFDNLLFGRLSDPPLTTIDVCPERIGGETGRVLVELMKGSSRHRCPAPFAPQLIARRSTRRKT